MTKIALASRQSFSLLRACAAVGALWLVTGNASLAANDVPPRQPERAEQSIEALLRKIEVQVSTGHAVSPAEDSGMETWKQVLRLVLAAPDSPGVHAALSRFATLMHSRAAEERIAGKLVVAGDLTLFGELAKRLLDTPAIVTPPVAVASTEPTQAASPAPAGTPVRPAPAVTPVGTAGPDPLSLDGHPPVASLSEADAGEPRLLEDPGNRFEPGTSTPAEGSRTPASTREGAIGEVQTGAVQNGNGVTGEAPVESAGISVTAAPNVPAVARHTRRAHRPAYKPWPPLTELPVMLPQPPPRSPLLLDRLIEWLRQPNNQASR